MISATQLIRPTIEETIGAATEAISSKEHLQLLFQLRGTDAHAIIDLLDGVSASQGSHMTLK